MQLADSLLANYQKPEDLIGKNGLLKQLTKIAIETVYPKATVQLCIVHMVRNSLSFVSWKMKKEIAADLRLIYTATTVGKAEQELDVAIDHCCAAITSRSSPCA